MHTTRTRRLWAGLAMAAGVVLAATACTGTADTGDSDGSVPTGTLTIANSNLPDDFDPVNAIDGQQVVYFQPIYDTLIRKQPDGSLTPMLATEWNYDESLTELTLTLRTDVTFTDGEALDADAVVANLEHQLESTTSPTFSTVAAIDSVRAEGDDSVVITLAQPDPGLLEALATNSGLIASPATLESGTAATEPVGSGPYILDAANTVVGDTYTYVANPDYWDPELQKYGTIVIKFMADITARLNALQSGQVEAAPLELSQYDAAEAAGLVVQSERTNFSGLVITDRDGSIVPALGDVRVREAIALALDRESLVDAIIGGHGTPTSQVFAEGSEAFVSELDDAYTYDVAAAQQLMSEAGYADGFEVTIPDMSALFGADLYAALVDQLDAINVRVVLDSAPIPDLVQRAQAGTYAMSYAEGQIGSSWFMISTYFLPDALQNQLGSTNADIAALIEDVRTTTGDEQVAAYQALNEYVVENVWIATLYRSDNIYGSTDTVDVELQTGRVVPYIYNYSPAA